MFNIRQNIETPMYWEMHKFKINGEPMKHTLTIHENASLDINIV